MKKPKVNYSIVDELIKVQEANRDFRCKSEDEYSNDDLLNIRMNPKFVKYLKEASEEERNKWFELLPALRDIDKDSDRYLQ